MTFAPHSTLSHYEILAPLGVDHVPGVDPPRR